MLSATMAERSDSTPARKAMVKALGKSATMRSIETSGKAGSAKEGSRPAKREPIVSVGSAKSQTKNEAPTTAMRKPGQFGRLPLSQTMSASEPAATANVCGAMLGSASQSAVTFSMNSAGSRSEERRVGKE